jgi:hypothetical protein
MTREEAIEILFLYINDGIISKAATRDMLRLLDDISTGCYGVPKQAMMEGTTDALIGIAKAETNNG